MSPYKPGQLITRRVGQLYVLFIITEVCERQFVDKIFEMTIMDSCMRFDQFMCFENTQTVGWQVEVDV